jgi:hypothetical protein
MGAGVIAQGDLVLASADNITVADNYCAEWAAAQCHRLPGELDGLIEVMLILISAHNKTLLLCFEYTWY